MVQILFVAVYVTCLLAQLHQQVLGSPKHTVPLVTGCGRGGTHSTASMLNEIGVNAHHEDYSNDGVSVGWPYAADIQDGEYIGYKWDPQGRYPFEKEASYNDRVKTLSKFSPVVQLVRDPIDVISSTRRCFCAAGSRDTAGRILNDGRSWKFVEHNINLTRYLDHDINNGGKIPTWSDLPYDDVRRSMVYYAGWNTLVEETHLNELAGNEDGVDASNVGNDHIVRLEDPHMLEKVAVKLGLSDEVIKNASVQKTENAASGKSSDADKEAFGMVTWKMCWDTAPKLAQQIWAMAQRFGYYEGEPKQLILHLKNKRH